jgi:hypothetical protein
MWSLYTILAGTRTRNNTPTAIRQYFIILFKPENIGVKEGSYADS